MILIEVNRVVDHAKFSIKSLFEHFIGNKCDDIAIQNTFEAIKIQARKQIASFACLKTEKNSILVQTKVKDLNR